MRRSLLIRWIAVSALVAGGPRGRPPGGAPPAPPGAQAPGAGVRRCWGVGGGVGAGGRGARAWLAARTTSGAIQQEQGQVFADDGTIYQGLLSYAATHPNWDGATPVVRKYAEATGRRVVLTTPQGKVIASSDPDPGRLPAQPSVVVDPLSVDPGLGVPSTPDRIDPAAVGPYELTAQEKQALTSWFSLSSAASSVSTGCSRERSPHRVIAYGSCTVTRGCPLGLTSRSA